MGNQNFSAKRASREDFVHKVEGAIRKGDKAYFHFIERLTRQPLLDISRQTLKDLRASIGTFSLEEQKFVSRLFSLPFRIVVRMSPGRLHWALKDGALFSTGLINSLGTKTDPFTPKLEDEMFGAFDYVFASYFTDLGQRMYGDVAVLLKPEVLTRSWGSRTSGWRVAKYNEGASLQVHQKNFLKEVIHPDHFREAIGLRAVYRFRRISPQERSMLLERPANNWPPLLYELGCGGLELKIKSYVLRQEIERVYLPPTARGEIPGMLRTYGIPFEYYHPGLKTH